MAFYDNWLDKKLQGLGYIKARQQRQPITALFAGETPVGAGYNWSDWTDNQIERQAVASAWVYSDVTQLAQMLSAIPFGVHEKSGEGLTQIESHPFEALLEWPNEHMDQKWLLEYSAWWYKIRGESYWWLVPDRGGQLAQMWPIPADRMQPIPDPKAYITDFAYTPKKTGRPIRIPAAQVCFIRSPNIYDFHRGLSPISAYRMALEADTSAAAWNRDTFEAGLTLQTLLSLPQETSEANFKMLQQEIVDELVDKGRRWFITRSGDVKAEHFGMTHQDAEFLQGRAFSRNEIDRVYGFPEGYWSVQANRANAEAAKATVIENAVWPMACRFAAAMTGQILKRYYVDDLRGLFEDVRPRDRALQVEERKVNWRVMTIDEARTELGLDPLDDSLVGETLVPLAIASKGGGGGFGGMIPPSEQEMKADLRRWESIARRRLRIGDDPAAYEFVSDYIPADVASAIKVGLADAATEEEVKAAFAAGFPMAQTADPESFGLRTKGLDFAWTSYP